MGEDDSGILNIDIFDDKIEPVKRKPNRTGQTEDEFQSVKSHYYVKVENGNLYKHLQLPLEPGVSKMRAQEVTHAVEELYFHRRFSDGIDLVNRALENIGAAPIDTDFRQMLESYREKMLAKIGELEAEASVIYSA